MNGHRAKKHLGQNFLHDTRVIQRIVQAIAPKPGERLVEIGPGLGALTRPLLEATGELDVVELDADVLPALRATCEGLGRLTIHHGDALKLDFRRFADGRPLRVVGNLPYYLSSPLLFHLLAQAEALQDLHFMLQKEVVDRICASPGTPDYGRLSVSVAARAEAVALFTVPPGAFRPVPKVDSAVVRLIPRPPPFPLRDRARFDRVVTAAFGQRRKQLANALRGVVPLQAFASCGIDPQARAEVLSAAAFARLADWQPEQGPDGA